METYEKASEIEGKNTDHTMADYKMCCGKN